MSNIIIGIEIPDASRGHFAWANIIKCLYPEDKRNNIIKFITSGLVWHIVSKAKIAQHIELQNINQNQLSNLKDFIIVRLRESSLMSNLLVRDSLPILRSKLEIGRHTVISSHYIGIYALLLLSDKYLNNIIEVQYLTPDFHVHSAALYVLKLAKKRFGVKLKIITTHDNNCKQITLADSEFDVNSKLFVKYLKKLKRGWVKCNVHIIPDKIYVYPNARYSCLIDNDPLFSENLTNIRNENPKQKISIVLNKDHKQFIIICNKAKSLGIDVDVVKNSNHLMSKYIILLKQGKIRIMGFNEMHIFGLEMVKLGMKVWWNSPIGSHEIIARMETLLNNC